MVLGDNRLLNLGEDEAVLEGASVLDLGFKVTKLNLTRSIFRRGRGNENVTIAAANDEKKNNE